MKKIDKDPLEEDLKGIIEEWKIQILCKLDEIEAEDIHVSTCFGVKNELGEFLNIDGHINIPGYSKFIFSVMIEDHAALREDKDSKYS